MVGRRRGTAERLVSWLIAVLAALPVAWLYLAQWLGAPEAATGFLQYDQAYYMANAREYFDHGFHLSYGLPFSADEATPRVYGQPQTFVLGVLLQSGIDPGLLYVICGLVAAVACLRIAIALAGHVAPCRGLAGSAVLVLVLWGGGGVVLSRLVVGVVSGETAAAVWDDLFAYDPKAGWWFLNFGRNLVYFVEAYYHALFLGAALLLLRRRHGWALAVIALASASHPFTGLQLLLAVAAWLVLERLVVRSGVPPWWFAGGVAALLVGHLGYYLGVLNWLSPEHRVLHAQWSLDWSPKWWEQLACWGPAAALAGFRLRHRWRIAAAWRDPAFRLLAAWFLTSFALVNHDLVIAPMQPLHFTRGYVWLPLVLIGLPALVEVLCEGDYLPPSGAGRPPPARGRACRPCGPEDPAAIAAAAKGTECPPGEGKFKAALAAAAAVALAGLFLIDNVAWLAKVSGPALEGRPGTGWALLLPPDGRAMTTRLSRPDAAGRLLLADDKDLAYLALVYTPLRSWASHTFNTLDRPRRLRELDGLFRDGRLLDAWRGRPLAALADKRRNDSGVAARLRGLGFVPVLENATYILLFREPEA